MIKYDSHFWSSKNPSRLSSHRPMKHRHDDNTWVLVFDDIFEGFPHVSERIFESRSEFLEKVTLGGETIASYTYLPIVIAKLCVKDLPSISKHSAFRIAFKQNGDPTPFLTMLKALDAMRNQSLYQFAMWGEHVETGKQLPSDEFEGGLWPEKSYPEFRGDSKSSLKCAPAIMAVINLSFGPDPDVDYVCNPVAIALEFISNSHLITVASGNSGSAPVNSFASPSTLCVGSSEDREGCVFANYSSFGLTNDFNTRGNDVVAFGGCNEDSGTSFAAPRVAALGCFCQAVLLQVSRIFRWRYNSRIAGVPIVGFGALDVLDSCTGLQQRLQADATPFVKFSCELHMAIKELSVRKTPWRSCVSGKQLKSLICSMARMQPGTARNKWGNGFVDDQIAIAWFRSMSIKSILSFFVESKWLETLEPKILNAKFVSTEELELLQAFVVRAAPIWLYDIETMRFMVNRSDNQGEMVRVLGSHGHLVINAFQEVELESFRKLSSQ